VDEVEAEVADATVRVFLAVCACFYAAAACPESSDNPLLLSSSMAQQQLINRFEKLFLLLLVVVLVDSHAYRGKQPEPSYTSRFHPTSLCEQELQDTKGELDSWVVRLQPACGPVLDDLSLCNTDDWPCPPDAWVHVSAFLPLAIRATEVFAEHVAAHRPFSNTVVSASLVLVRHCLKHLRSAVDACLAHTRERLVLYGMGALSAKQQSALGKLARCMGVWRHTAFLVWAGLAHALRAAVGPSAAVLKSLWQQLQRCERLVTDCEWDALQDHLTRAVLPSLHSTLFN
jgi:hypothetical protein